jgi:hypothetical protein
MKYVRPPLKGIPIRHKKIKGKLYAYQRVHAYRDKATGQVVVKDRHLGAVTPARPKPMLEQLTAADYNRVAKAWRDGEDMDLIIARIEAYTGDQPSPATVYNFMRTQGIKREHRTTKRAEKRITETEAQVERIRRHRADEKERKARQARRRIAAQKEIERG